MDRRSRALSWSVLVLSCALSAVLIILRWQVAPPAPVTIPIGEGVTQISQFYPPEQSADRSFRWSKSLSAVSLPSLSFRQVVSVTLDPARPVATSAVKLSLLVGTRRVAEFTALPGWHSYTATLSARLAPDVRLLIESDTFYPSASDRRRLGVAVSELSTAPAAGPLGIMWPPLLWIVIAVTVPALLVLLWWLAGLNSPAILLAFGVSGAVLPLALTLLLPVRAALPAASWIAGLGTLVCVLLSGRRVLAGDNRVTRFVRRAGASRWELPIVAVLMLGAGIAATWPLVMRLNTAMPGWPADNFAFLYKFWWFRTSLLVTHRWPFFDPNTFAPFGFNLGQGEPTLANTLPGVIPGALFGDVASYNILLLASFLVTGLGGYLLGRELTGSKQAGLVAGLALAICPYRMAQLAGHIQLLGTGWIVLSFYFVERVMRGGKWRDGLLCGACFALAALSAWYYAYMVGLALLLYISVRLWTSRRVVSWRGLLRPTAAGIVAFALLAGPVALPSLSLWEGGGLRHSAKAADEHSAAPVDYLLPNELQPIWGAPSMRAHSEQNVIENSLYLGSVAVVIAVVGWLVARRRRSEASGWTSAPAWFAVLVVSLVLSLGLTLHDLSGQVNTGTSQAPVAITMPGRLLYDWLPLFSSMRAYARFGFIAALALFALMSLGWAPIVRRAGSRALWWTGVMLVLLVADFWTAPYAWGTTRVEPSPVASYLAAQPPGAVMQMPLTSALSGPALFRATEYGKPIAYGYDTFEPPGWAAARPALAKFPEQAALDVLRSWGVRYVVVSANAYGADWPGTLKYLSTLPGLSLRGQFDSPRVWDVDPAVIDNRPDMEEYIVPDTFAVFELTR